MERSQIDQYLARICVDEPVSPDVDGLRRLQAAHLATVPFENLSIHLGEPIILDEDQLFDKIVTRRRGGFCYELNGLFAALLTALGYRIERLSARVFGSGQFGAPFDHMALRVDLDERWLADVGFGRFSEEPLLLDDRNAQIDPSGTFHIECAPSGHGDLDVRLGDTLQYRIDPRPYDLADFAPTCWWQQTSPESHFTRTLACSLPTPTGRVTLSGDRLIITTGEDRTVRTLESDAEVLDAYGTYFGIHLTRVPIAPSRGQRAST